MRYNGESQDEVSAQMTDTESGNIRISDTCVATLHKARAIAKNFAIKIGVKSGSRSE